jgi:acyl-CoA reductase-like NAD-dependent aldehyde dehydrogenase
MSVTRHTENFINGAWVASTGDEIADVFDSTTGKVMATLVCSSPADVDAAVRSAREAFIPWSGMTAEERATYLDRIAQGIASRASEFAPLIARETGMPVWLCELAQVGSAARKFAQAAELIRTYEFEAQVGNSLVLREPIGVVGCITPWNFPIAQVSGKVGAALAAGCVVVVKPSELAPSSNILLAEVIDAAGLMPGVFNIVNGTGPVAGEALASHPEVDMVSFTGSTRAGRRVGQLAIEGVKRVTLELGGKSANVLLSDLDEEAFSAAVIDGIGKAYFNSGQTCAALTRMLVPRDRLALAESVAAATVDAIQVGDPFAEGTALGPLASSAQQNRVEGYIQKGIDEGARVVTGGLGRPEGLDCGYYVRPTVFSGVTSSMTIAQEEIFGPVLSILPYDTEGEALAIANSTVYGLSGGVWAANSDRAKAFARGMRAGQVEINGGTHNPLAPFGGYKQSGVGRESGKQGLEEFFEVKSLQL